MNRERLKERISTSLWVAPGLGVLVALGLGILMITLDRVFALGLPGWLEFRGGIGGAEQLLSTVTSSILTFTALVFTITVLVLQLASNQLSPRVIRTFLHEPATKWAMAVFVGTFVYSLLILSRLRNDEFRLSLSTWLSFVLALVSVGVFIRYIHTMAHSIRAITLITRITTETRTSIDRMYPEGIAEPAPVEHAAPQEGPDHVLVHQESGQVLAFVEMHKLVAYARECDLVVEIVPQVGDFIPQGAPLFYVWGHQVDDRRLRQLVAFEPERVIRQDPAFGFRQLVDIAARALSPGTNDPTTATQVLDHLHDLLRRLTLRRFPPRARVDEAGDVRVVANRPDYEHYVRLAFAEILHYGADAPQVVECARLALEDCYRIAPAERRGVLAEMLGLLAQTQMPELRRAVEAGPASRATTTTSTKA